jgi:hypothetical protein
VAALEGSLLRQLLRFRNDDTTNLYGLDLRVNGVIVWHVDEVTNIIESMTRSYV